MINMKVKIKTLIDTPNYDKSGSTPTLAAKTEIEEVGILQGYTNETTGSRNEVYIHSVAIVLVGNKLKAAALKDIIVLTDEE